MLKQRLWDSCDPSPLAHFVLIFFFVWVFSSILVAISTCEDSFNIFRFDRDALNGEVEEGEEVADDEDVKEVFEVVAEVSEDVSLKSFLLP